MKFLFPITLLMGLAVALEFSELETRQRNYRPHKKTSRPKTFDGVSTMRAPTKPKGAPADFKTGTDRATLKRSKAGLKKLPVDLIDPDMKRRRASLQTLRLLGRQSTTQDFYECGSDPAPADADCQVIIDQAFDAQETLVVNANACLTFVYQTCKGFFCALCETLATTTDFVANQLDSAEALCVADGLPGTIVGEDKPQWDAGFVRAADGLPTYDVC